MRLFAIAPKVVLAAGVALTGLAAAPAAHAEPVPDADSYYVTRTSVTQNPNANTVTSFGLVLTNSSGAYVPEGTEMTMRLSTCQNDLATQSVTASQDTGKAFLVNFSDKQQRAIGPSIEYAVTVTQPGYDPYVRSGSYDGYTVKRPSCAQINSPSQPTGGKACQVKKWSSKIATPRDGKRAVVGGTAKVTATSSPNCQASYTWKAGGKKVGTGRALKVRPAYAGKTLSMTIQLKKPGLTPKTKTLTYGKVRGR